MNLSNINLSINKSLICENSGTLANIGCDLDGNIIAREINSLSEVSKNYLQEHFISAKTQGYFYFIILYVVLCYYFFTKEKRTKTDIVLFFIATVLSGWLTIQRFLM